MKMHMNVKRMAWFACCALAAAVCAMPTKDELAQAQQLVQDLTAEDLRAIKAGTKKPSEVAAAHLALADEAETEAGKYILLQGAFRLYVRSGDYDSAASALQRMRDEIAGLPPEVIVEIVNKEMRRVASAKAPKVLAIFRDAQRMIKYRKQLAAAELDATAHPENAQYQRRLAECHVGLGDWEKALQIFAEIGDDAAKHELDPDSAKDFNIQKAANYWWDYSAKDTEPFKAHAVTLYKKGLEDGSISGLHKTLAEKRIKEMENGTPAASKGAAAKKQTAKGTTPAGSASNGKEISVKLATGVTMDFVPCPAGSFEMGCDEDEQSPLFKHKVTITRPFWIGKYQVTRGIWELHSRARLISDVRDSELKELYGGKQAAMVDISFHEVLLFCDWLNRRQKASLPKGYIFRLPTEAEWEYALNANGGKPGNPYVKWRDGDKSVESQIMVTVGDFKRIAAEHNVLIKRPWRLPPMTVGTKAPNDWGIYDMLGNGREFVLDTVNDSGWTGGNGRYYDDDLKGKGILIYKESETDPLHFVAKPNSWSPLIRGDIVSGGGRWYMKSRAKPNWWNDMFTTFRVVIGPDLLKERGIKLPKLGK